MAGSCFILATLVAAGFTLAALQTGTHSQVDLVLGAAWTFTLSLIVSSPVLIPRIKRRLGA